MKTYNGRTYYLKDETCHKCETIFQVGSNCIRILAYYSISTATEIGKDNEVYDINHESIVLCENCAPTMDPGDIKFFIQFDRTEVLPVTKNVRIDDYK